jgi:hypothetical protein
MRRGVRIMAIGLPLAALLGVALGDTTVAAMQVRRAPITATPHDARRSQFDLGQMWAATHHPRDADACPQRNLLFQVGCIARTQN